MRGFKIRKIIAMTSLIFLLSNCAHNYMRGTVTMKTDDQQAHVCLGSNDVELGDKVDFFDNVCLKKKGEETTCKITLLGTGTVTKLLNTHYSVVKADSKFKMREGNLVQKRE